MHTTSCGHGYSTIKELAIEAAERKLELICITEHSGLVPRAFFKDIMDVPNQLYGVEILKGAEVDIISSSGDVSLADKYLESLHVIIASFHRSLIDPKSKSENTQTLLNVIKKHGKQINILGHLDDLRFEIDYDLICKTAKENNIAIELNDSSLNPNKGRLTSFENILELLNTAKKHNCYISIGSDAHNAWKVGSFENAIKLIEASKYPEELILNTDINKFKNFLAK